MMQATCTSGEAEGEGMVTAQHHSSAWNIELVGPIRTTVPTKVSAAWDNGVMNAAATEGVSLRHVLVVGGTVAEWAELPADQWADRLYEWGKVADHVSASWLTVRPFGPGHAGSQARVPAREVTVGTCVAVAQPEGDGRARLTRVIAGLQRAGEAITEASIDAALNAPALVNPDLVVVVGAKHRMPPSLVWELAYSELVFVDTTWQHFAPGHLDEAIGSYARRHRRFGGID